MSLSFQFQSVSFPKKKKQIPSRFLLFSFNQAKLRPKGILANFILWRKVLKENNYCQSKHNSPRCYILKSKGRYCLNLSSYWSWLLKQWKFMTVIIFYVNCLVMCGVTRKKDGMKWPRAYTDEHGGSFLWQGGNCLQQLAFREKKAESSHLRGVILGYSQFTSTAMLFNSQLVGLPLDRKVRTGLICFYL